MIYQTFAQLYDQLFDSDMYKSWEKFTLANINKKNGKLLDLAGGSGRLAVLLAKDGINVTVADFSDEMLSLADQHSTENNVSLQLVQADMRDLSGLEKFQNYLEQKLLSLSQKVSLLDSALLVNLRL